MKVLAINGSPRPDGNTAYAIGLVLGQLEQQGIETEVIQVGGKPFRAAWAAAAAARQGAASLTTGSTSWPIKWKRPTAFWWARRSITPASTAR